MASTNTAIPVVAGASRLNAKTESRSRVTDCGAHTYGPGRMIASTSVPKTR
jgi:hypothetical protein